VTQPPDPELPGVRALVTGGTSGLGFAMSQGPGRGWRPRSCRGSACPGRHCAPRSRTAATRSA